MWQDRLIHYVSSDGVVYLVMADDSVGRRMPFAFLAEMERRVSCLMFARTLRMAHKLTLVSLPTCFRLTRWLVLVRIH